MAHYKQFNIRFCLDNPMDRAVYKAIDDLDLTIHKSKNRFIMKCLYDCINGYGIKYLERQGKRESYVTVEEYERQRAEDREQIRNEVYQDLIRFLATVNVSRTVLEAQSEQSRNGYTNEPINSAGTETPNELPKEMMDDIMTWS